jgi:DNA-binding MarR family transcriptional regulator
MARPDPERLALWWGLSTARDQVVGEVAEELDRECGLLLTWFTVLDRLANSGGRLRLHDLAERSSISPSSLSRLLERLVDDGLVDRVPTPSDGRGAVAVLTKEGRQRYRDAVPVFRRAVQQVFARHLTDTDVAALQRVLPKLAPDLRLAGPDD